MATTDPKEVRLRVAVSAWLTGDERYWSPEQIHAALLLAILDKMERNEQGV